MKTHGALFIDRTGKRYGHLVCEDWERKNGKIYWKCKCDCGNTTYVKADNLANGHTKSCGCGQSKSNYKHGMTKTRLHRIWQRMIRRCCDKNEISFKWYGAKGVTVCDEWLGENGFVHFRDWSIKNGYTDELSIDRIDCSKGYSPNNCRWATRKQQDRNKSNSLMYEVNGKTKNLADLAEEYGIKYQVLYCRLKCYGWSIEEALGIKERLKV